MTLKGWFSVIASLYCFGKGEGQQTVAQTSQKECPPDTPPDTMQEHYRAKAAFCS